MSQNKLNKLELTWIGKYDERKPLEPRILIETKTIHMESLKQGLCPTESLGMVIC